MTRVIKFRAWDGNNMILPKEKHYYQHYVAFSGDIIQSSREGMACFGCVDSWTVHTGEITLMQFTGLFDGTKFDDLPISEQKNWLKNNKQEDWKGKEIYEGDIVEGKSRDPNKLYIGKVHFDSIYGSWVVNGYDWEFYPAHKFQIGIPLGECRFEIEVIGNIYENGDLLNDK